MSSKIILNFCYFGYSKGNIVFYLRPATAIWHIFNKHVLMRLLKESMSSIEATNGIC